MNSVEGDSPDDPSPGGPGRSRPRLGTVLATLVVAATVGMWLYLFLIADPNVPDELDDDTFPAQGQAICAAAVARIDDLPPARDANSPEDRSEAVAEANEILTEMVADLRAIAPTEGSDDRLTRLWLEDWDTYLADRAEYADRLAAGEDAELLITARGAGQITVTLDHFAVVNGMEDCQSPLDA